MTAKIANGNAGFEKMENVDGECEQLTKKSMIARLRGDEKLAEDWAQNHNKVWEDGMKRMADNRR